MTPEIVPLEGWHSVAFPPEVLRFPNYDLTGKTLAMDVRDPLRDLPVLITLNTAADDSANGVRIVGESPARIRVQIDKPTMAAAYATVLAAGLMRAGEDAVLVFDLLAKHEDGFVDPWIEGPFIIHAGTTQP